MPPCAGRIWRRPRNGPFEPGPPSGAQILQKDGPLGRGQTRGPAAVKDTEPPKSDFVSFTAFENCGCRDIERPRRLRETRWRQPRPKHRSAAGRAGWFLDAVMRMFPGVIAFVNNSINQSLFVNRPLSERLRRNDGPVPVLVWEEARNADTIHKFSASLMYRGFGAHRDEC